MKKLIPIIGSLAVAGGLLGPLTARADERDEVIRSAQTIDRLERIPERAIPAAILRNARGIAIIRMYKAGLGLSGRVGSGVVVARTPNGGWSGPTFIGSGGVGWGPQVGLKSTDYVLVLNTKRAVDAFSRGANVTLGGDLSAAVGPVGRTAELSVTPIAAVYTYSQSRGLFVGASLEGTVITSRPNANADFYGRAVSPRQILTGRVTPPRAAAPLTAALRGGPARRMAPIAER